MAVDEATVSKIARLARIAVSEQERSGLADELSHILTWVERLNEVDTEGVAPMTSVVAVNLAQRTDRVSDGNRSGDILANAPCRDGDYFVVPKVIE